ncbi:MAG: GAF domain-containing protein [Desulfuromonadales bacterium]|nr:GAF domain-containing protein [Desulfuromonadales bacterium]
MSEKLRFLKSRTSRLAIALSLILVGMMAASTLAIREIKQQAKLQTQRQQEQALFFLAKEIDSVLRKAAANLNALTEELVHQGGIAGIESGKDFAWNFDYTPEPFDTALILADSDGNLLFQRSLPPESNQPFPMIQLALRPIADDSIQCCRVITSDLSTYLQFHQTIRAKDQRIIGNLNLIIDLSRLINKHTKTPPLGSRFFALYGPNNSIIMSPHPELVGKSINETAQTGVVTRQKLAGAVTRGERISLIAQVPRSATKPTARKNSGPETSEVLLSLAPLQLPGSNWSLAYILPTAQITISTQLPQLVATTLILAMVGAVMLFFCGHRGRKQLAQIQQQLDSTATSTNSLTKQMESYRSRYEQLVQSTGDAFFVVDLEHGALLEINRPAETLLGYTQGEVEHLTFKVLFSREQQNKVFRLIAELRKHGQAQAPELKFRRKDGSSFIGEVRAKTGWREKRRVIYGSLRDVTPAINLMIELRRHNRQLSLLNDIIQRVTEGHDLETTLKTILDETAKSFGVSGGGIFLVEERGSKMRLALHRSIPDDVLEELKQIQPGIGLAGRVVETGRPRHSTDLQKDHRRISGAVAKDGWHAFLAIPIIAERITVGVLFLFDRSTRVFSRNEVRLIQAIGRQVGPSLKSAELFDELQWQQRLNFVSLRELERSRKNLRDDLEQLESHHRMLKNLNNMKSTFLSLASHELRTPLTSILSGAEFLQDESGIKLDPNGHRALDVITRSGQRLNTIIDDLLEAARLEAQDLYLAEEVFNPLQSVKGALAQHQTLADERKVEITLGDLPDDTNLKGDSHHLQRAIGRLIENAIKFTPEDGQVQINGSIRKREDIVAQADQLKDFSESFLANQLSERYLEINICDSGIGIEPEELLRVFDKFHEVGDISVHSTSQVKFCGKGVGLGLTLAKGVVESHKGLIWVESAGAERGSSFSILLPIADPDEGRYVHG